MSEEISLIVTVSLIIIASPFIAKLFRLPITPIEITLGSVFGYIGLIHSQHLFDIVAEFGFLYLMFIAGTEINLKNVLKIPASLMKKIILYLILLYSLSLFISLYLNLSNIFIVLLPLISVGLVASLSKEYGKQEWLSLSMTAGGIGEVVSIVLLTITSSALVSGFGINLVESIIALSLFLTFMFVLFRLMQLVFWWFPEMSTALMPYKDNKEQDVRLSVGIFFLLIATMLYLKLELAFGAFLAGMFIPSFFEHKKELPEKLASFGFGFLIPVFFIHIGYTFDLEALNMDGLIPKALTIAIAMILMRVVASSVFIGEVNKLEAILIGLSHSMPLTLLIAMATLAYHANSIDILHYYAFILAAIFQVISVMITIKLLTKRGKHHE